AQTLQVVLSIGHIFLLFFISVFDGITEIRQFECHSQEHFLANKQNFAIFITFPKCVEHISQMNVVVSDSTLFVQISQTCADVKQNPFPCTSVSPQRKFADITMAQLEE